MAKTKPYKTLPLAELLPLVGALVDKVDETSRTMQRLLYGKDFVSGRDATDLSVAIQHLLGDFLEKTMDPERDSMRYAPDGKGGFTR
jgi:hypothetical protein